MELGNAAKNTLVNKKELNKYFISDDKISVDYKNDSHSLIATQIKENSIVLDVGCAQGIIGNFLNKERNCKVYGIEIDSESRKIAKDKNVYEEIYDFSVSNKDSKKYMKFFNNNLKFDYIIFADILEHLIDPADTIYEFTKLLNPNGKILISLPNISHFDIIHGLLNDKFNYSKMGLLDNTHIRFFTKNSFIDMINEINDYYNINLKVKLLATTIIEPEYVSNYPNLYSILKSNKEINVLQNIFELSIGKTKTNKRIAEIDLCKCLETKLHEVTQVIEENNRLNSEVANIKNELDKIYNSKGYKLLNKFYKLKNRKAK